MDRISEEGSSFMTDPDSCASRGFIRMDNKSMSKSRTGGRRKEGNKNSTQLPTKMKQEHTNLTSLLDDILKTPVPDSDDAPDDFKDVITLTMEKKRLENVTHQVSDVLNKEDVKNVIDLNRSNLTDNLNELLGTGGGTPRVD